MFPRIPTSIAPAVVALVATLAWLASAPPAARAVQRSWTNAAGGAAGTSTNWNPAGIPGPLDQLIFGLASTYAVTFATPVDSVATHNVLSPSVGFSVTGTHRITDTFEVGGATPARATLTLGTLSARAIMVGRSAGQKAALFVTGAQLVGNGHIDVSGVGASVTLGQAAGATGNLYLLGGGNITANGPVALAPAGACSVSVAGGGLAGLPRSALRTAGPNGHVTLAGSGTAWLDLFNNGVADIAGDLSLAASLGSSATMNVYRTPTGVGVPLLTVRGRCNVGGTTGSSAPTGTAQLTVGPNGAGSFLGPCTIGSPASGGIDRLTVTTGGAVTFASGLRVYSQTNGRLDVSGGSALVTGGSFWYGGGVTLPVTGPGLPSLQLLNGGPDTIQASSIPAQPALLVGGAGGAASMTVRRPGTSLLVMGPVNLGADSQSGALTVDSSASVRVTGLTHIGGTSNACQLTLQSGGAWTGTSLELATAGGGGGLLADGAGSSGLATGDVSMGPGTAWLQLHNGASFQQTSPAAVCQVGGSSSVEVLQGSTFTSAGTLTVFGDLLLSESSVFASRVNVASGGSVQAATGLLRAEIAVATGGLIDAAASGYATPRLEVGTPLSPNGFACAGSLHVSSDTLVIRDADGAQLGNTQLLAGCLDLPAGSRLMPGTSLSGDGTLFGDLTNLGTVYPGGVGLALGGRFASHGGAIAGGVLRVISGGQLEATGEVSSPLENGGTLRLGDAPGHLVLSPPLALASKDVLVLYTQLTSGSLVVHVGAPGSASHDTLQISGTAVLEGRLELWTSPGYLPAPGDTFTVLTAGAVQGTFGLVQINGGPAAGHLSLVYGPTTVRGVFVSSLLGVDDPPAAPEGVKALRFAAAGSPREAALMLELPAAASARVTLYDVTGRQAAVLADGELAAGRHRLALADTALPSGVYFARAVVRSADDTRVLTTRVVRLR